MLVDNVDLQDEEFVKTIIMREATKTSQQKWQDLKYIDSNLMLKCETENGFM